MLTWIEIEQNLSRGIQLNYSELDNYTLFRIYFFVNIPIYLFDKMDSGDNIPSDFGFSDETQFVGNENDFLEISKNARAMYDELIKVKHEIKRRRINLTKDLIQLITDDYANFYNII